MSIKAIQTRHGGCLFRSRTEARWAVLFDALGIKWEYEPEGFELKAGRYLPDFWLPDLETWVEVKGAVPSQREMELASALANESDQLVLIVSGVPECYGEQITFFRPGKRPVDGCYLASRGTAVTRPSSARRKTLWLHPKNRDDTRAAIPTSFLNAAITKARSARFEFGAIN